MTYWGKYVIMQTSAFVQISVLFFTDLYQLTKFMKKERTENHMKKFGKFLVAIAAVGAAFGGIFYVMKKKNADEDFDDFDEDFDDFDDDFDDEEEEEEEETDAEDEKREYTTLTADEEEAEEIDLEDE